MTLHYVRIHLCVRASTLRSKQADASDQRVALTDLNNLGSF